METSKYIQRNFSIDNHSNPWVLWDTLRVLIKFSQFEKTWKTPKEECCF